MDRSEFLEILFSYYNHKLLAYQVFGVIETYCKEIESPIPFYMIEVAFQLRPDYIQDCFKQCLEYYEKKFHINTLKKDNTILTVF